MIREKIKHNIKYWLFLFLMINILCTNNIKQIINEKKEKTKQKKNIGSRQEKKKHCWKKEKVTEKRYNTQRT